MEEAQGVTQEQRIRAVCERTGFEESRARLLLQTNQWSVQKALAEVAHIGHTSPGDDDSAASTSAASTSAASTSAASTSSASATSSPPHSQASLQRHAAAIAAAAAPPRTAQAPPASSASWFSWLWNMAFSGAQFFGSFVFSILPFSFFNPTPARITNPVVTFDEMYGTMHPRLHQGRLSAALVEAEMQHRLLLVLIHSRDHEMTRPFMEGVFCTEGIQAYVDEHFLCWLGDVEHAEATHVARHLAVTTYPYLAVLTSASGAMRDSNGAVATRVLAHTAVNGMDGPDFLVAWLEMVREANEEHISHMEAQSTERQTNRMIMEEQDLAYQRSLEADREKQRAAEEAAEREKREKEEEERRERERIEAEERAQRVLEEKRQRLPSEPEAGPDVVRLMIQLPSGERMGRRFRKLDSLEIVYDFVDTHQQEFAPGSYVLESQYPKKSHAQRALTLEESGLSSEVLYAIAL